MNFIRFVKVDAKDGLPESEYPARNGPTDPVEVEDVISYEVVRSEQGYDYAIYIGTTSDDVAGVVGVLSVLSSEEVESLLNAVKSRKHEQLNSQYGSMITTLESDYPASERESWHVQVSEARDIEGDTPWIDAAAQARGLTREDMAALILAQDAQYRVFHGSLTGKRQAYRDQINNSNDVVALSKMSFDFNEANTDSD